MIDKTIEELKAEAEVLNIDFNPRIGADKLAAKIEAHYATLESAGAVKVKPDEPTPDKPGVKTDKAEDPEVLHRRLIQKAKADAMATRVVTLTNTDKRENDVVTSVYLAVENQFFGIARYVPLDIPVELEMCLIDVAKNTLITLHKDEIIDGRRTGNRVPVSTRKFTISYEDVK